MPRLPARFAGLIAAALALSACATHPPTASPPPVYSPSRHAAPQAEYGRVTGIQVVRAGDGTGAGAAVGAVIGAVLGRQFADGQRGKNIGTAVGAVGGALIGNEIEKDQRGRRDQLRVTVQLDGGAERRFDVDAVGDLRVGDRVRVQGQQLYRL